MTAQRIPVALQSVFLASNRGSEVFAAPPENAASKTFVRPPSVGMNGTTPRGNTRAKIRRFFSFNMGSKWPQPHERRYEIGSPVKSPAAKGFEPTTPRRTSSFEPPAMPFPVNRVKPNESSPSKSPRKVKSMDTQSFVGATETTASPTKHSKGHSDKSAELSPRKSLKKQKSMESPRTVVASETLSSPTKHSKAHPERSNESSPRKSPKKQKSMDSPRKTPRLPSMSPQVYLDSLMSNRGYCTERICSNKTAYHNSPTPLQKASYHSYLVNVARSDDIAGLTDLISSGLSPNPANNFGESLCHTICRLGNSRLLQCLLDCGATLDFCDDYGRTPLHDACWTAIPAFDVVDLIMTWRGNVDTYHLFTMVDSRGSTPLSYIRREHWAEWLEFLVAKKDVYWPAVDKSQGKKDAPAITRELPHSRPRPDPENALSVELAGMVASGIMSPIEARLLVEDDSESSDDEDDDDSDSDSDCDDSDSDDSDSDDCSSSSCSDDEEECILLDEASMSSILMHIQETDRTRLIPCMSH